METNTCNIYSLSSRENSVGTAVHRWKDGVKCFLEKYAVNVELDLNVSGRSPVAGFLW